MLALPFVGAAQYFVNGVVFDETYAPIPFAKVFVKNAPDQRTVADIDGKYQISLARGEYFLVFSSTGFDTRESYVSLNEKNIIGKSGGKWYGMSVRNVLSYY